jgi:glyoxylase-like metal-dependent hydrolase (beta-lactamase superfamily II)
MTDTAPATTDSRPERSEKREARELITELAPNVLRTELPIQLPGLGHVNMYVLEDSNGIAVVDPGLPGDGPWKAVVHRLGLAGFKVEDVHSIVVTHSHYDHYGAAERLREVSGAKIVAHPMLHNRTGALHIDDDTEMLDVDGDAPPPGKNSRFGHWTPWGTWSEPPEEVIKHWENLGLGDRMFVAPEPDIGVPDGVVVSLAGREWVGVHTPGHTADHLCLYDAEEGLMITGDHVLPTITPHISGYSHEDAPLQRFFDSLNRMHDYADVKLALPAHGDPFDDLSGRSTYIHDHHVERLDELREAAENVGKADVETYMQQIFRERSWGHMAASETFAHLDHLRDHGELSAERVDGLLHFEPSCGHAH